MILNFVHMTLDNSKTDRAINGHESSTNDAHDGNDEDSGTCRETATTSILGSRHDFKNRSSFFETFVFFSVFNIGFDSLS
jgi:hypothetical protein